MSPVNVPVIKTIWTWVTFYCRYLILSCGYNKNLIIPKPCTKFNHSGYNLRPLYHGELQQKMSEIGVSMQTIVLVKSSLTSESQMAWRDCKSWLVCGIEFVLAAITGHHVMYCQFSHRIPVSHAILPAWGQAFKVLCPGNVGAWLTFNFASEFGCLTLPDVKVSQGLHYDGDIGCIWNKVILLILSMHICFLAKTIS